MPFITQLDCTHIFPRKPLPRIDDAATSKGRLDLLLLELRAADETLSVHRVVFRNRMGRLMDKHKLLAEKEVLLKRTLAARESFVRENEAKMQRAYLDAGNERKIKLKLTAKKNKLDVEVGKLRAIRDKLQGMIDAHDYFLEILFAVVDAGRFGDVRSMVDRYDSLRSYAKMLRESYTTMDERMKTAKERVRQIVDTHVKRQTALIQKIRDQEIYHAKLLRYVERKGTEINSKVIHMGDTVLLILNSSKAIFNIYQGAAHYLNISAVDDLSTEHMLDVIRDLIIDLETIVANFKYECAKKSLETPAKKKLGASASRKTFATLASVSLASSRRK